MVSTIVNAVAAFDDTDILMRRPGMKNMQVSRSQYSDWLQAVLSGSRIPVGVKFSAPVQIGPAAQQASCTRVPDLFPGRKAAGAWR
jgi:hypothetical protein